MTELTYTQIGKKLKKARELSGLTQAQVASFLDTQRENISYYENGKRHIDTVTLKQLSDLYGYTLSYFLEKDDLGYNPVVSSTFRTSDHLSAEDLSIISWAKKFAMNLDSLKRLLEE